MATLNVLSPDSPVLIKIDHIQLEGILGWPDVPRGIVLFANGSGNSRSSPCNAYLAHMLQKLGFATLLFDLLTEEETQRRNNVFEIPLLAERLEGAREWLEQENKTASLPHGYFGVGTGGAAALQAAAIFPKHVKAVVSRGGRPDLAKPHLSQVAAPTLLIVGGKDDVVLKLNREAYVRLTCHKDLLVVPGASQNFEEPGAMEEVAQWAGRWFSHYLVPD